MAQARAAAAVVRSPARARARPVTAATALYMVAAVVERVAYAALAHKRLA